MTLDEAKRNRHTDTCWSRVLLLVILVINRALNWQPCKTEYKTPSVWVIDPPGTQFARHRIWIARRDRAHMADSLIY